MRTTYTFSYPTERERPAILRPRIEVVALTAAVGILAAALIVLNIPGANPIPAITAGANEALAFVAKQPF